MAQIFPEWTNKLPLVNIIAILLLGIGVVGFFWYFGSTKYTDVGYRPTQPIPYSHKLHAGDLGLDCRYCHVSVELSPVAVVPPTQTCMNCHSMILPESQKLLPVRESWASGETIKWIRVHNLPDYAYFNHSAHINAGVSCISCHGNLTRMIKVMQVERLSMSWCLDCHRDPAPHLRPIEEITNMRWLPGDDHSEFAERIIEEKNISPPEDCSGCHR
ncbi:MAG: cytochrome C [candidate division Zixibacteria bacterium]|nr:cytochrome C [candidate division Zixibacteria bacterium]